MPQTMPAYEDPTNGLKRALHRNMTGAIGLLLLAVACLGFLSIATWSVNDPSLNHATSAPVQNILGAPGAVTADLLIQLFGLASAVLLIPIAVWGWRLLFNMPRDKERKRLLAWAGAVLVATLFAAVLPGLESWPLPSGLGGVIGDFLAKGPAFLLGPLEGFKAFLIGLISGIGGLYLLLFASGRGALAPETTDQTDQTEDLAYSEDDNNNQQQNQTDEADDEEEGHILTLGALTHWFLSTKANVHRQIARNKPALEEVKRKGLTIHGEFGDNIKTARRQASAGMDKARSGAGAMVGLGRKLKSFAKGLVETDDGLDDFYRQKQGETGTQTPADMAAANREPSLTPHAHSLPMTPDDQGNTAFTETRTEDWQDPMVDAPFDMADKAPLGDDPSIDSEGLDLVSPVPAPQMAASPEQTTPAAPQATRQAPAAKPKKTLTRNASGGLSAFTLPSLDLLTDPPSPQARRRISPDQLQANAELLESTLEDFGVKGEIIHVRPGPVVTLYELEPAPGTKSSRVIGLADDIARSMSAISARVAVVQGRNAIGIELPNANRETVYLRELLDSGDFNASKAKLPLCLGHTIDGTSVVADLARMPHLLIAGTTGSGKSVAINTFILSLLYRLPPEKCRMIMVDPKMLELSIYDGIPHLLTPVVTDPKKAVVALKWTVREMEERYKKMSKVGVRNIDGFNSRVSKARAKGETITRTVQTGFDRETGEAIYEQEDLDLEPMPYIVVVVDEMADLMMVAGKDIEGAIQRLAQMARAAGIHLIMATQRPSVDVITGTIKANFPTRISFAVTSKIDSRTILGEQGAEQLLGQGDMLYMAGGGRLQRVHGPFVSDDEVEHIVTHLKDQGIPEYLDTITEEDPEDMAAEGGGAAGGGEGNELYDQAVAIVLRDRKASTSYIQRRLSIGYNRAATLIERMEQEGVIGPANHAGKREILVPEEGATM